MCLLQSPSTSNTTRHCCSALNSHRDFRRRIVDVGMAACGTEFKERALTRGRKSGPQQISALQGRSAALPHGKKKTNPGFPFPRRSSLLSACWSCPCQACSSTSHTGTTSCSLLLSCKRRGAPSWEERAALTIPKDGTPALGCPKNPRAAF